MYCLNDNEPRPAAAGRAVSYEGWKQIPVREITAKAGDRFREEKGPASTKNSNLTARRRCRSVPR